MNIADLIRDKIEGAINVDMVTSAVYRALENYNFEPIVTASIECIVESKVESYIEYQIDGVIDEAVGDVVEDILADVFC